MVLQAGETLAHSDGRSLHRFLSTAHIGVRSPVHLFPTSPGSLRAISFLTSQCWHCDVNSKVDELYTGKQRWGEKNNNQRIKGRGSDACLASVANVLLSLMPRQLSGSRFERYFYEVTSVFMAAALVTADEYKEKSRRRAVWDHCHILIPRTAPALSVLRHLHWLCTKASLEPRQGDVGLSSHPGAYNAAVGGRNTNLLHEVWRLSNVNGFKTKMPHNNNHSHQYQLLLPGLKHFVRKMCSYG